MDKLIVKDQSFDFYAEAESIAKEVTQLKVLGVGVIFDKEGMRVTEIGKEPVRQDYFYTGRELRRYRWGLIDMKAHTISEEGLKTKEKK